METNYSLYNYFSFFEYLKWRDRMKENNNFLSYLIFEIIFLNFYFVTLTAIKHYSHITLYPPEAQKMDHQVR